jgi:hypothetical protein
MSEKLMKKDPLNEKIMYNGNKTTSITVEITEELNEKLTIGYTNSVHEGKNSLTYEQYVGGFVDTGYNWFMYNILKQIFGK